MNILKPEIIVKKNKKGNYILKKRANLLLILSLSIFIFFILKGLKKMEEMDYLFNIEYIGTNIVAFLIFFIYLYTILVLFSKETLEFKNREIEIKKYLLFYCFYRKKIKISEIVKIKYIKTGALFFNILLTSLFFNDDNNISIQANTGLDEDEVFYFGAVVGFEGYKIFCKVFREVTNRDRVNIYFLKDMVVLMK